VEETDRLGWDKASWDSFVARLYRQREFVIKLGLAPILEALELEGQPQRSHARILVAGSNGKGQTSAFISAILKAHGLRVGFFSSPHIIDFRERFRVDGRLVSRAELMAVGNRVLERYGDLQTPGPQLTFFESAALMAALVFQARSVDVGVYEVGLGGRLDATNALEPDLSVVTSIGLDHTDFLGETLEAVAGEKAGIFRADRPAIIARQAHEAAFLELRRRAPADALFFGNDFRVDARGLIELGAPDDPRATTLQWAPDAAPTAQWNAACASAAAARFLGHAFEPSLALKGLNACRWPGRLDRRRLRTGAGSAEYDYLFDAAHNPDAAAMLFEHIERNNITISAVLCTSMRNKDVAGTFANIPAEVPVFAVLLDFERAAKTEQLRAALSGKDLQAFGSTQAMLAAARAEVDRGGQGGVILVFGSIYLLGECFSALGVEPESLRSDIL